MKRISITLFAMVLCLSVTACAGNQQSSTVHEVLLPNTPAVSAASTAAPTKASIESQLQTIAENSSMWLDDADAESYGFAVTDLNHNSRLEVVFSTCQGTGIYSYNQIWEINKEFTGLTLCEAKTAEGDSEADIMVQSVLAFYDPGANVYYYIFDDLIKNGAAEYYENKRAISLQEGNVLETPLAYKSTIYSDSGSAAITCTDPAGQEIAQEEYESIAERTFGKYEKHGISLGWVTNATEPLKDMNAESLYSALTESYRSFAAN